MRELLEKYLTDKQNSYLQSGHLQVVVALRSGESTGLLPVWPGIES